MSEGEEKDRRHRSHPMVWTYDKMNSIWKIAGLPGVYKSLTHFTSSGKYHGGEGGMLYVPDAFAHIGFFFSPSFSCLRCGCGVRWSKWVKNSDIKKRFFKVTTPESIGCACNV